MEVKATKEIFELVKKLTGAKSVVVLIGDQEMPCEAVKNGGECLEDHDFAVAFTGMEQKHVGHVLHYMAHEQMEKTLSKPINESMGALFGNEEGDGEGTE